MRSTISVGELYRPDGSLVERAQVLRQVLAAGRAGLAVVVLRAGRVGAALALGQLAERSLHASALFADRTFTFGQHAVLFLQRLAHAQEEMAAGLARCAHRD